MCTLQDDELDISPVEIDEGLVIEDDEISDDDDDDDDENDDVCCSILPSLNYIFFLNFLLKKCLASDRIIIIISPCMF